MFVSNSVKGVIINVLYHPKSEVLTILSRDCIENTENYRVMVEYVDAESGHKVRSFNVSFQANISIDLRKHISINHAIYTFQITIVEYTLNVILDKRTLSLEATEGELLQSILLTSF